MLYTTMQQTPSADTPHLKWAGDLFEVTLRLDRPRPGRAVFRTNLGMARVRRRELIASTESGEPVLARDWHDILNLARDCLSAGQVEIGGENGRAFTSEQQRCRAADARCRPGDECDLAVQISAQGRAP